MDESAQLIKPIRLNLSIIISWDVRVEGEAQESTSNANVSAETEEVRSGDQEPRPRWIRLWKFVLRFCVEFNVGEPRRAECLESADLSK